MMDHFTIDDRLLALAKQAEIDCKEPFARMDEIAAYNEEKVLAAFMECRVSDSHFKSTTGYGYGDSGRDKLDEVYAKVFRTEDALVRHNFVSGTHALAVALFGVLRTGDRMVSLTGQPYDTMEEVIGLRGEGNGSLKDYGISYDQVDLTPEGTVDFDGIREKCPGCKVAYIQRSRGYSLRESLCIDEIERIIQTVRSVNPEAVVVVDNCYGEFVEKKEPTEVGADLMVGSLIKNAGGGIAATGGYIAGKAKYVELCSYRLTVVGVGKDEGCTLDQNRGMFMGFFFAPSVVCNAVKTNIFALRLFELLGFTSYPSYDAKRTDLIAALVLGSGDRMLAFCQGIQQGSPVDSFVKPEAWAMPGYDDPVVMAAGAFTMGSSIELSADGPMREPYAVWLQGGLTYHTGRVGILLAAQKMLEQGLLPNL